MAINFLSAIAVDSDVLYTDTTNNRVGIGTTSPAVQLELGDNTADEKLRLTGAASGKPLMTFYNTTTKIGQIASSSVGVTVTSLGSGNMSFENGGNTRLVIDNSGNIGIGTTSPAQKLDVAGDATFDGRIYTNATALASVGILGKAIANGWAARYDSNNANYSGFFFDANNDASMYLRDDAGNTNVLVRSDSSSYFNGGNVGIGETNPAQKLHVIGNSEITGDIFLGRYIFHNDDNNTWLGFPLADTISFRTNGSDRMYINSSGNVGIGTTSPNAKLQINNSGSGNIASFSSFATAINNYAGITLHTETNSGNDWYGSEIRSINTAGNPSFLNPRLGFFTQDNDTYLPANRTEKMSILGNGSVGIGTPSPSEKLHVYNGKAYVTPIAYAANQSAYALKVGAYNSTSFDMGLQAKSTSGGSPYMSFRTTSVDDALTIWGGSVGVGGIGIPSYTLDVDGQIRGEQYLRLKDTAGTNQFSIRAESTYGTLDNGSKTFNYIASNHLFLVGVSEKMRINSSGNVGIGTTSPASQLGSTKVLDISSTGNGEIILDHTDAGVSSDIGLYSWNRNNDHLAHIKASCDGATDSAFISFHAQPTGGSFSNAASNEKMRIKSNGDVGIGVTLPQSKLQVGGGVQLANDTDSPSASKVGTFRYYTSGNNSYVDMCMQTGAATYAWVNIVTNSW